MRMIDSLIQKLPKLGGWPEDAEECYWHSGFLVLNFYHDGMHVHSPAIKTEGLIYSGDENGESVSKEEYEAALAASKAEWGGEGLPPVGVVVEVSVDGGRSWCSYKALSESNGVRLVEIGDFTEDFQANNYSFRPIRSEADMKRDALAKELVRFLDMETDIDNVFTNGDVIGFYDYVAAGKIPGVKLED